MTAEHDDRTVVAPTAGSESTGSEVEHLRAALTHRTDIGIAMGVVMTRLGMDQNSAFGYLRRVSSVQNRKLHLIAAEIAATRELPQV